MLGLSSLSIDETLAFSVSHFEWFVINYLVSIFPVLLLMLRNLNSESAFCSTGFQCYIWLLMKFSKRCIKFSNILFLFFSLLMSFVLGSDMGFSLLSLWLPIK